MVDGKWKLEKRPLHGSLDELRPFSQEDLLDPWTGQSLRLQSDAHSFTVYSVGADEKDDGGDLVSERRIADERGYGIRRVRGKDIGIRVLLNPK